VKLRVELANESKGAGASPRSTAIFMYLPGCADKGAVMSSFWRCGLETLISLLAGHRGVRNTIDLLQTSRLEDRGKSS